MVTCCTVAYMPYTAKADATAADVRAVSEALGGASRGLIEQASHWEGLRGLDALPVAFHPA